MGSINSKHDKNQSTEHQLAASKRVSPDTDGKSAATIKPLTSYILQKNKKTIKVTGCQSH